MTATDPTRCGGYPAPAGALADLPTPPAGPGLDLETIDLILAHPLDNRPWRDIIGPLVAEVRRLREQQDAAPAAPTTYALPAELRGNGPCGDCATVDNIVWFTESVFWNRIMRRPDGSDEAGGIVCVPCFVKRVRAAGLQPTGWRLLPDFHWETVAENQARRGPLSTVPPAGTEGGQ